MWNLVSLCKECHQSIHSVPARISIEGYVNTSSGVELKYKINTNTNTNTNTNSDTDSENDTNTNITTTKPTQNNKKNNKHNSVNNSVNNSGKIDTTEINNLIVSLKQSGLSPRKIQYDLKREYNYDITQQKIRDT